jgi:hypothetical protein
MKAKAMLVGLCWNLAKFTKFLNLFIFNRPNFGYHPMGPSYTNFFLIHISQLGPIKGKKKKKKKKHSFHM